MIVRRFLRVFADHHALLVGVSVMVLGLAGCNVRSNYSYSSSGGQGRSTSISGSGGGQRITAKIWNSDTTAEFSSQGEVTLTADEQDVADIQPTGHLRVTVTTGEQIRQMEWKSEGGELVKEYKVNGAVSEIDADADAWVTKKLSQMVLETPIGAKARALRVMEEGGSDGLLAEIKKMGGGGPIEEYFRVLVTADDLTADSVLNSIAHVSTMTSSSDQEDVLKLFCGVMKDDESVSDAIADAVAGMDSPSHQEDVLVEFAKQRTLTDRVAIKAIDTVKNVSSSSHQEDALRAILKSAGKTAEIQTAYVRVVDKIDSSSKQEDLLNGLIASGISDDDVFRSVISVVTKIGSTSAQEDVMVSLIKAIPPNKDDLLIAALDVVPKIGSSSSQEDVMEAVLKRSDISKSVLEHAAKVVKNVGSSSTRKDLQAQILERMTE